MTATTATIIAQLRALLTLTNAEIQLAQTRVVQARTEAVRNELQQNASNGEDRAQAIKTILRELGGAPSVIAPAVGRITAAFKAAAEQAQPFDEALLGDLALEHQLLDRSRYLKALATSDSQKDVERLAERLITAHSATVDWLITVLAEDALGGPAALRRTPTQAVAGAVVGAINAPINVATNAIDRAINTAQETPEAVRRLVGRGAEITEVAARTAAASRDAALEAAEATVRDAGKDNAADALHKARAAAGSLDADELPIEGYEDLTVNNAVAAIRELTDTQDVRTIVAYEERNKNRQGVVSAAQTHVASLAREAAGVE
ncbi:ferritin-like domain-containing protein [Actinomycetes bacterium M1A6_2h]